MKKLICLCLLLISPAESHAEQTCVNYVANTTPDNRYIVDAANGTVTDKVTGLMWQQCSVGQVANAGDCNGSATEFIWYDALQVAEASTVAGFTDWRLPNKKELHGIVAYDCYNPSINLSVFPSTPVSIYWSSSPVNYAYYRITTEHAWSIDFGINSRHSQTYRGAKNYVRLVR